MPLTKEQKIHKNILAYIERKKFLKDPKYYKNQYWSMAAWDSWAAQGKAGGCSCCPEKHYNGSLVNRRAANKSCKQVCNKLCSDCINKIEVIINHKFDRKY